MSGNRSGEAKDLNSFGGSMWAARFAPEQLDIYVLAGASDTYLVADVKGNYTARYFNQGELYDGRGVRDIRDSSGNVVAAGKITLVF